MSIGVEYDCRECESEALELLESAGLHTLSLDVPPVDNDAHWHHFHSVFFILSGDLLLTDAESGLKYQCGPGSRVTVPPRSLHYEHSTSGYRIALGTSIPASEFGDPVNRSPASLKAH